MWLKFLKMGSLSSLVQLKYECCGILQVENNEVFFNIQTPLQELPNRNAGRETKERVRGEDGGDFS